MPIELGVVGDILRYHSEPVKYARENITDPQDVFRSPTEALRPWLQNACVQLNDLIFTEVYDLAYRKGILNPDDPPVARVGTELELLLFSDQFDSRVDKVGRHARSSRPNPNYTPEHEKKIERFLFDTMKGKSEGGLGYILQSGDGFESMGRILAEMRAKPANVAGYMSNAERIEEYMREQAEARGIRPVVHANHLHVSLTDSQGGTNLMNDYTVRNAIRLGILDAYHRLLPLSRLPEEVESGRYSEIGMSSVKPNGSGTGEGQGPTRVEGRVNSTEYMYDPYLTLFVNLLGVYRGLRYVSDQKRIDKGYRLKHGQYGSVYFKPDRGIMSYRRSVNHLLHDPALRDHLEPGVIRMLQRAFKDYWKISTGEKTVAQVRSESEALAQRYAQANPLPKYTLVS